MTDTADQKELIFESDDENQQEETTNNNQPTVTDNKYDKNRLAYPNSN